LIFIGTINNTKKVSFSDKIDFQDLDLNAQATNQNRVQILIDEVIFLFHIGIQYFLKAYLVDSL
jgi:hypothetical protein